MTFAPQIIKMILRSYIDPAYYFYQSSSLSWHPYRRFRRAEETTVTDAQQLADRYVAVWNDTDAQARRRAIAALWTPDGVHYIGTREARGYDALESRITGSHEKNVRDGGHRFRAAQGARALRDVVTFFWEMLPADTEKVVAAGLEFLIVDGQGRIRVDYQFVLDRPLAPA
jgi:hypothetical protein